MKLGLIFTFLFQLSLWYKSVGTLPSGNISSISSATSWAHKHLSFPRQARIVHLCFSVSPGRALWWQSCCYQMWIPGAEDSQSLDTKLKLMADIKLEMEALMVQIKTKTHNTKLYHTIYNTIQRVSIYPSDDFHMTQKNLKRIESADLKSGLWCDGKYPIMPWWYIIRLLQ